MHVATLNRSKHSPSALVATDKWEHAETIGLSSADVCFDAYPNEPCSASVNMFKRQTLK